jgi:hypothetical protein
VAKYQPDLLCLQEVAGPRLPARLGSLTLASVTSTNYFRVALYVREDRFDIVRAASQSHR